MKGKQSVTVTIFLCVLLLITSVLSGCSSQNSVKDKPVVVVQSLSTTEDMQRAIEEQCPDITIKWYLSSQVHENAYLGMTDTPDILLRQAYYMDEQSSVYLRDISEQEITNKYSKNIIDSFRASDGALYWLPVLGSGYVLVANKTLFEEYDIPLPTDYQSLVAADAAFKEHGLDGVAWGISADYPYSAMLIASSLGADLFNSIDGMNWRNAYMDNSGDYTLDETIWPEIFQRYENALEIGLIDKEDMASSSVIASNVFSNKEAAMVFIGTASINAVVNDMDVELIPIFDANDNAWLPLYMNLRVGISANVTDERLPNVLKVMEAIISSKTYSAYSDSRGGVVPMNNDGDALEGNMTVFKSVVDNGNTFLLVNDNNHGLIEGLNEAFHRMADEHLPAEEAYRICCESILSNRKTVEEAGLNSNDADAVFYTSDVSYPLVADSNHNSPTNSAIANSLLDAINTYSDTHYDILLMEGNLAGAPIRSGPYYTDTNGEVNSFSSNFYYLFNAARSIYPATMTVKDLIQYINSSFYYFHRIDDGMAIMAGASYKVDKYPDGLSEDKLPFTPNGANKGIVANLNNYPTCYVCTGIQMDGKDLPLDQELSVLVGRVEVFYITDYDSELPSTWVGFDEPLAIPNDNGGTYDVRHLLAKYLSDGHKLAEPTQYVELTVKS